MVSPATASSGRPAAAATRGTDAPGPPTATRRAKALAHRLGYGVYFLIPHRLRRALVRVVMARYTVGAVALVRDAEQPGRLLLLRHPRSAGWSLPAGLLQRGERPVDGCARELAEETGVRLRAEDLTPAVPNAVVHSRAMVVDTVFEARVPASAITIEVDGAEVAEAGWHRLDNLPPLTTAAARLLSYYGIGPYTDYPEVRM
ncbi:MAG TPA: NUDIX domain-containing protein [Micromonosporaceae bacterium]|jgi:ADP-ribose pyrophosphatase YjhB (NUDIX family)